MIYIGIDPGKFVNVAAIYVKDDEIAELMLVPTRRANREDGYDVGKLYDAVATIIDRYLFDAQAMLPVTFVLEKVIARPGFDIKTQEILVRSHEMARTLISLMDLEGSPIRLIEPRPAQWKAALNLTRDKKTSLTWFKENCPDDYYRARLRQKDHDRVEAYALAWYGWKLGAGL